jgi:hypothetical protein
MGAFTALVKIYSTKCLCNTKAAGLGEIFVQQKFAPNITNQVHFLLTLRTLFQLTEPVRQK